MLKNTLKKIGATIFFIMCTNVQLTAASSESLTVTATRVNVNTITLSAATLSYLITNSLFNNVGSDSEALGSITVTATKQTADSHRITITQSNSYPSTAGNNPSATQWALFRTGGTSANFMLLVLQSNVATSATTTFTPTSPQTIAKISQSTTAANLTAATTSTYANQQLTLTFSVQDGQGIDLTQGDYVGNFSIAIGASV